MTTEQTPTEALYEISLAIRQRNCLAETVREAVSAYVDHLDCSLGGVFERTTDPEAFEMVGTVPVDAPTQVFNDVKARLATRQHQPVSVREPLPLSGQAAGTAYRLFELPEFGVLVLANSSFDDTTALALDRVNEQFAVACCNVREAQHLQTERDRFEVIFDAIQEPIVATVHEEGDPVVRHTNDAFLTMFGFTESEVVGASVNDLIVPPSDTQRREASQIDDQLAHGETVTREIRRETADGTREFLLRAVPVTSTDRTESVGIYVDITDNKVRQRRFEWLYNESRVILSSTDTNRIYEHALAAGRELVDFSRAAVYRYDREVEALVPAVASHSVSGWESYTDESSLVWDVYRNGPRWIETLSNYEATVPGGDSRGSGLCVPLGEHGVMMLRTDQSDQFDETDFQVLKLLATVVETALDRVLREQGLKEVQSITRRILDADDHEEAARGVLEQLPAALDMPMSAIWRYDDSTGLLDPVATTEPTLELFDGMPSFSGGDSIAWRAFKEGETKLVADVPAHDEVYNQDTPLNSEILMPLGTFGVLSAASTRRGSFTEAERRLLETLAANVETAMQLVSRRHERDLLDQVVARVLRHNLRNDLNVIQGHAMALSDSPHAEAIIDHCKDLQKTAQNARRMRQIVNTRGETTAISFPETVDHALRRITEQFPEATVTVEAGSTPQIIAHPALPTAIAQLLENSIKHADCPPTDVSVTISSFEADNEVVVEITDNGPGIPQEELKILKQHGESALEHGSGAGLWMVDRVVEYSKATIEFDTDNGTTVRLRFDPA